MNQKKHLKISLIAPVVLLSGILGYIWVRELIPLCVFSQYSGINGVITRDVPRLSNPNGCGYCFTSDDGKYNCVLMTGKGIPVRSDSNLTAMDLDQYVDRNVVITAKEYQGVSTIKCPIRLDIKKIEIR